jgi:hypothetical protein
MRALAHACHPLEPGRAESILSTRPTLTTLHTGAPGMTAIHGTAYPRLRSTLSDKELEEIYPPPRRTTWHLSTA